MNLFEKGTYAAGHMLCWMQANTGHASAHFAPSNTGGACMDMPAGTPHVTNMMETSSSSATTIDLHPPTLVESTASMDTAVGPFRKLLGRTWH